MIVMCAGCDGPIVDRFLLTVVNRTWHSSCVRCCDCHCPLLNRCFSRDGHQLFCKMDFFRRFGSKCGGCKQGIAPTDLVRRARDCVYHVTCFNCTVCGRQLSTGDEMYILDDSRFICKDDFSLQTTDGSHSVALLNASSIVESTSPPAASATSEPVPSNKKHLHHHLQKQRSFFDKRRRSDDDVDDDDHNDHNDDDDDDDDEGEKNEGRSINGDESRDSASHPSQLIKDATAMYSSSVSCCERSRGSAVRRSAGGGEKGEGGEGEGEEGGGGDGADPGYDDDLLFNHHHNNCSLDSVNCSDENSNSRFAEKRDEDRDKENAKEGETAQGATKRRGPRTTIKAKQLETLKSAFSATPKPTRHIREQLAQETGLNMRVIQVWFQNRRSKERRMKQLTAMGVRRQFYRSPRRLRTTGLPRPGDDFNSDAATDHHHQQQHPHPLLSHHQYLHHAPPTAAAAVAIGYFGETTTDFYSNYPMTYDDFFPLHGSSSSSSAVPASAAAVSDSLAHLPPHLPPHPSSLTTAAGEAIVVEQVSTGPHLVSLAVDAYNAHHALMHHQHPQ